MVGSCFRTLAVFLFFFFFFFYMSNIISWSWDQPRDARFARHDPLGHPAFIFKGLRIVIYFTGYSVPSLFPVGSRALCSPLFWGWQWAVFTDGSNCSRPALYSRLHAHPITLRHSICSRRNPSVRVVSIFFADLWWLDGATASVRATEFNNTFPSFRERLRGG